MDQLDYSATQARFTGFETAYNGVRPAPPTSLAEVLLRFAQCPLGLADMVVDLGCGTGLSTRYWSAYARQVIGIEPTASMRIEAERHGGAHISYRHGYSHATGLPAGIADLVVCSQALHWMEPSATFTEAARLLRPGGVFAACDYDWPPCTGSWEADQAYAECMAAARELERLHRLSEDVPQWDKAGHLSRLEQSGQFRFVREILLHHREAGSAERLVSLYLTQGYVQTLLKAGFSESQLQIDRLRSIAQKALGHASAPWHWSARVRLGIK